MTCRAVPALLVVFVLLSRAIAGQQSDVAQQTGAKESPLSYSRADVFSTIDSSELIGGLPMLGLLDGRRLPISGALARMGMAPLDLFPAAVYLPVETPKGRTAVAYETDTSAAAVSLRAREYYYGGEAGVFYGKSTGKYGGEQFASYVFGTVGNDKFQITAGASYQESTMRFPRNRYWSNH